jgi:hypothetical protein
MENDKSKRVQNRAYELWEKQGRPEGRHEEHWKQAEEEFSVEEGFASLPGSGGSQSDAPSKGAAKRKPRRGSV